MARGLNESRGWMFVKKLARRVVYELLFEDKIGVSSALLAFSKSC